MSHRHTLPPAITAQDAPKAKETRRRRGVGGVWRKRTSGVSDAADEIDDSPRVAPTPRSNQSSPGTSTEAATRHVPSTSGKLSPDTLKVMLQAQEVTTRNDTQS